MRFLTNINSIHCCQTPTNEKLISVQTNSCKQQKHLGSSKILSLNAALLGKMHALLQDVLYHSGYKKKTNKKKKKHGNVKKKKKMNSTDNV